MVGGVVPRLYKVEFEAKRAPRESERDRLTLSPYGPRCHLLCVKTEAKAGYSYHVPLRAPRTDEFRTDKKFSPIVLGP